MLTCPKHIYIHWPFCHSKCRFCDFVAFQQHEDYQETYHRALCTEITTFASQINPSEDRIINTIFFGGGTPSLYPLHLLGELFDTLKNNFDCSAITEATIEANPTDIIEERLDAWQSFGINRLSIGVQCLDDALLKKLNRRQRTSDVMQALIKAPKYFDNISVDLILGLPGIIPTEWFKTLMNAINWPIRHISIYYLTLHEKTPLYFDMQQGILSLPDDETIIQMYEQTVQILEGHDFLQYEISNFAKIGYASCHNLAYWDRRAYKGFGIGAASFDGNTRTINTNNLTLYLQNAQGSGCHIPCTQEKLSSKQVLLELLMLGLRQKKGINLQYVVYFLSDREMNTLQTKVRQLVDAGLLGEQQGTICLTLKGMALENEIITRLLSP